MKYFLNIRGRRSIRIQDYDYSQNGMYFFTICTQNREYLLGEIINEEMILNKFGKIVMNGWKNLPKHYDYVQLDEFIIMPNHIHGIIIINHPEVGAIHESPFQINKPMTPQERRNMGLTKVLGRLKMVSAKQINQMRQMPGIPVWQRNYYEHIIRNEASMEKIKEYILNNPKNWDEDELNRKNYKFIS